MERTTRSKRLDTHIDSIQRLPEKNIGILDKIRDIQRENLLISWNSLWNYQSLKEKSTQIQFVRSRFFG